MWSHVLLLFCLLNVSMACQCVDQMKLEQIEKSSVLFKGIPVHEHQVDGPTGPMVYFTNVTRIYRQRIPYTIKTNTYVSISVPLTAAECGGFQLNLKEEYLIDAFIIEGKRGKQYLQTNICTTTAPWNEIKIEPMTITVEEYLEQRQSN